MEGFIYLLTLAVIINFVLLSNAAQLHFIIPKRVGNLRVKISISK